VEVVDLTQNWEIGREAIHFKDLEPGR
jgi:hypothetical protein